jgi:AcrR family transcriptional regulator
MTDLNDRILKAAARVYSETGYRGTTTRRVAQEADVNEVTLFRHFGTKETLVKAALKASHSQGAPIALGEPIDPRAELQAWALRTYRHWYAGRQLISRVMGDLLEYPELAPSVCEEPSGEHAMLSRYLERMRALGWTTRDFHADGAAGLLLGAVFTHALWRDHFEKPDLPPPEVVVEHYVDLLLSAVGMRRPGQPAEVA